jgi:hypothetical protein
MESRHLKSLTDDEIASARMTRRSAFRVLGAAAVGATFAGCYHGVPRGCSDADPQDPRGAGRHCGVYQACSDRDPYDAVGHGRHC